MSAKKLILLTLGILLAFTAVDVLAWYASPSALGPAGRVGYPFRPLRVLLPSAVVLVLVFLFLKVKPLNRFAQWTGRNIIDPDTRLRSITLIYIVGTVCALLHHIVVTLYHKYVLTGGTYLATGIPLLIFVGVTILLGRLWKDKLFWIFLLLFYLKLFDTAWQVNTEFLQQRAVFIMAAYAFFGCYGVARVLRRENWKTFFSVLCPLWVLASVILAAFGIWVACTGVPVKNLGTEQFVISDGRIYFAYHPVTSGILLSTAMAVALFGCALARKKALRVYYIVCAVILFLAGSLTGTRVVCVLSGVELACMLCLMAYDRLKPGEPKAPLKTAGKWIALAALFAAVTVAVTLLQSYTPEVFSVVRSRGALVSTALAEDAAEVSRRGFLISMDPDVTFTGRFTIWKNAWNIITSDSRNLLFGQPVYSTIAMGSDMWAEQGLVKAYHCHNTILQTLFENGIPGLLLFLSFLVIFVVNAFRVLLNRDLPFWQRLLPLPVICGLISDLLDSTCHVNFGYPQMTLLYLFAGFTIVLGQCVKKKRDRVGGSD